MRLAAFTLSLALSLALGACSGSAYETSWPDPRRGDDRATPQQGRAGDIEVDEDYARNDDRGDRAAAAAQCGAYGRVRSGGDCVPAAEGAQRERRPGEDFYP